MSKLPNLNIDYQVFKFYKFSFCKKKVQLDSRLTMSSRHSKSVVAETIVFALFSTETIIIKKT